MQRVHSPFNGLSDGTHCPLLWCSIHFLSNVNLPPAVLKPLVPSNFVSWGSQSGVQNSLIQSVADLAVVPTSWGIERTINDHPIGIHYHHCANTMEFLGSIVSYLLFNIILRSGSPQTKSIHKAVEVVLRQYGMFAANQFCGGFHICGRGPTGAIMGKENIYEKLPPLDDVSAGCRSCDSKYELLTPLEGAIPHPEED